MKIKKHLTTFAAASVLVLGKVAFAMEGFDSRLEKAEKAREWFQNLERCGCPVGKIGLDNGVIKKSDCGRFLFVESYERDQDLSICLKNGMMVHKHFECTLDGNGEDSLVVATLKGSKLELQDVRSSKVLGRFDNVENFMTRDGGKFIELCYSDGTCELRETNNLLGKFELPSSDFSHLDLSFGGKFLLITNDINNCSCLFFNYELFAKDKDNLTSVLKCPREAIYMLSGDGKILLKQKFAAFCEFISTDNLNKIEGFHDELNYRTLSSDSKVAIFGVPTFKFDLLRADNFAKIGSSLNCVIDCMLSPDDNFALLVYKTAGFRPKEIFTVGDYNYKVVALKNVELRETKNFTVVGKAVTEVRSYKFVCGGKFVLVDYNDEDSELRDMNFKVVYRIFSGSGLKSITTDKRGKFLLIENLLGSKALVQASDGKVVAEGPDLFLDGNFFAVKDGNVLKIFDLIGFDCGENSVFPKLIDLEKGVVPLLQSCGVAGEKFKLPMKRKLGDDGVEAEPGEKFFKKKKGEKLKDKTESLGSSENYEDESEGEGPDKELERESN